jgi:hypothetical protein
LLDVSGLNRAGLLEITRLGRDPGAIYRTLGRDAPLMDKPMRLSGGNVAVIGMSGLRAELNTLDPSGQGMARPARPALADRSAWWLLPLLVVGLVAGLLAHAYRARKNRKVDGAD